MSSTWFITGASRGLGRELTEQALARGDSVAATLRTPSQLDDLAFRSAESQPDYHRDQWLDTDSTIFHGPSRRSHRRARNFLLALVV